MSATELGLYDTPLPPEIALGGPGPSEDDLGGEYADDGTEVRPPWSIPNDELAEWAGRKLAAAETAIGEAEAQAGAWRERIDAWLQETTRGARNEAARFSALLERYALERRAVTGKATLTLPSVTVRTRETSERVVVDDEDQFLAWAAAHGDCWVRVVRKADAAAVRAGALVGRHEDGTWVVVNDDGEPVPGLGVEPGKTTASVHAR